MRNWLFRTPWRHQNGLPQLLLLCLVLIGAGIGLRDPWMVDEDRFMGVALEMLQNQNWMVPFRASEAYADKPPLFFWALAATYSLFGSVKLTFLLPALCSALVSLVCVHDMARRLFNRRVAWVAGLLLIGTWQFQTVMKMGQIDAFLFMWINLALYGLLRHLLLGPDWRWYWFAFACMGFGVISKGVGFLPLLMLIPYFALVHWRAKSLDGGWKWWFGIAFMLLAVAVWLAPMAWLVAQSNDPALEEYRNEILFKQTGGRYVNAWAHREPIWYFFTSVIPKYWLPMFALLPWLLPAWWRRMRRMDSRYIVLLGYVVLVLVFFSLSSGKRKLYIFPAVPALVLASAPIVTALWERWTQRYDRRKMRIALVTYFSLWLVWGLAEPLVMDNSRSFRPFMQRIAAQLPADAQLALFNWDEGAWLFARTPITHFGVRHGRGGIEAVLYWLQQSPTHYALMEDEELGECFDTAQAVVHDRVRRNDYVVVDASAITGACEAIEAAIEYNFRWEQLPR
jgi:4-amino-4-deoxy-L-arabinose transferase-like glycosyltransferase